MRLLVRHGLNGEEELAIEVGDRMPAGWDIMVQLARCLNLRSPFQIILDLDTTAAILPPTRTMGRGMGSPIPCGQQGEVGPRGSGGTLNCSIAQGSC